MTKSETEWHVQFVVGNYLRDSARLHLRPVLFNIFLCDLFQLFVDLDITNYADDSTPHSTNITLNKVLHDLEKLTNTLFK